MKRLIGSMQTLDICVPRSGTPSGRDLIPAGVFHGEDEIPVGTFHGEDEIPPGTFHDR